MGAPKALSLGEIVETQSTAPLTLAQIRFISESPLIQRLGLGHLKDSLSESLGAPIKEVDWRTVFTSAVSRTLNNRTLSGQIELLRHLEASGLPAHLFDANSLADTLSLPRDLKPRRLKPDNFPGILLEVRRGLMATARRVGNSRQEFSEFLEFLIHSDFPADFVQRAVDASTFAKSVSPVPFKSLGRKVVAALLKGERAAMESLQYEVSPSLGILREEFIDETIALAEDSYSGLKALQWIAQVRGPEGLEAYQKLMRSPFGRRARLSQNVRLEAFIFQSKRYGTTPEFVEALSTYLPIFSSQSEAGRVTTLGTAGKTLKLASRKDQGHTPSCATQSVITYIEHLAKSLRGVDVEIDAGYTYFMILFKRIKDLIESTTPTSLPEAIAAPSKENIPLRGSIFKNFIEVLAAGALPRDLYTLPSYLKTEHGAETVLQELVVRIRGFRDEYLGAAASWREGSPLRLEAHEALQSKIRERHIGQLREYFLELLGIEESFQSFEWKGRHYTPTSFAKAVAFGEKSATRPWHHHEVKFLWPSRFERETQGRSKRWGPLSAKEATWSDFQNDLIRGIERNTPLVIDSQWDSSEIAQNRYFTEVSREIDWSRSNSSAEEGPSFHALVAIGYELDSAGRLIYAKFQNSHKRSVVYLSADYLRSHLREYLVPVP
jgi:hypothetical protein